MTNLNEQSLKTAELFGGGGRSANCVQGYCLKADVKHYFDTVNHEILLGILQKKICDGKVIWLIRQILNNFDSPKRGTGMPLGNFTSQFFANVYLNELDYFVKHTLKAKYYIRYVDDFIILHRNKNRLYYLKRQIEEFLKNINLELHPNKSDILPIRKGITFLGYRVFYYHRLLRKRNQLYFGRLFRKKLELFQEGTLSEKLLKEQLEGWFGYARWANTYKLRNQVKMKIIDILCNKV